MESINSEPHDTPPCAQASKLSRQLRAFIFVFMHIFKATLGFVIDRRLFNLDACRSTCLDTDHCVPTCSLSHASPRENRG